MFQPRSWAALVNQPQTEAELEAIRRSVPRSHPLVNEGRVKETAKQLGLESTLRFRARPKNGVHFRTPHLEDGTRSHIMHESRLSCAVESLSLSAFSGTML